MTNKVITISRQFGSGGRSIGKAVAEKLGIPYYDKELVDKVAKESGFSHEFIEEIGEYASVTSSFLFNIAVSSHPMGLIDTMSVSDKLYVCQTNVIRDLASKGPCVIVGRGAEVIQPGPPAGRGGRAVEGGVPGAVDEAVEGVVGGLGGTVEAQKAAVAAHPQVAVPRLQDGVCLVGRQAVGLVEYRSHIGRLQHQRGRRPGLFAPPGSLKALPRRSCARLRRPPLPPRGRRADRTPQG